LVDLSSLSDEQRRAVEHLTEMTGSASWFDILFEQNIERAFPRSSVSKTARWRVSEIVCAHTFLKPSRKAAFAGVFEF
jgi:hypothetical protein